MLKAIPDSERSGVKCDHYASDAGKKHIDYVPDVVYYRCQNVGISIRFSALLRQRVVEPVEFFSSAGLMVEDLYDLLSVHHLLDEALGSRHAVLLTDEVFG